MIRPSVGVGVIILKDEQVLLLKRKGVHGSGSWSPPGGHLEFGESFETCAIRETQEETGLIIADVRFRAITNDLFEAEGKHYITVWMEGIYVSGEAVLNAPYEASAIGWFHSNALPQPLFLPLAHLLTNQSAYPPYEDPYQLLRNVSL